MHHGSKLMHHVRTGTGPPLLLIHGLGGSWRSWKTILPALAAERRVVAVDLPGFGESPPLPREVSIAALADALEAFLAEQDLGGVDVAGSSMGGRLALELARRGQVGATVALDPGGFWDDRERWLFGASVALSIRLVRGLQPLMEQLTANPASRTLLLAQFSARPWALPPDVALSEMRDFAAAISFDAALRQLFYGPPQEGAASTPGPVTIGWGRRDRVTLPRQAARAVERFPEAHLVWFDDCGHFPHWDQPEQTTRVILQSTG